MKAEELRSTRPAKSIPPGFNRSKGELSHSTSPYAYLTSAMTRARKRAALSGGAVDRAVRAHLYLISSSLTPRPARKLPRADSTR